MFDVFGFAANCMNSKARQHQSLNNLGVEGNNLKTLIN